MGRRRSKIEILREKRTQWINWGQNWYSQFQICPVCNEMALCRGKTPNNMKCKLCHFGYEDNESLQNALTELQEALVS